MAGCIAPAMHVFHVVEKQFMANVMESLTANRAQVHTYLSKVTIWLTWFQLLLLLVP